MKTLIKDNETPKPSIESPTSSPAERVPILIEITEEDRQNAQKYWDSKNCLVCTALKRMGYKKASTGPRVVHPFGYWKSDGSFDFEREYISDDIGFVSLQSDIIRLEKPFYTPEVVGKQIILYPV